MKSADLTSGAARLHVSMKNLLMKWEEAREQWRDQTAAAFEEHHFAPIEPQVTVTLETIARLSEMLDRALRECGEGEIRFF